MTEDGVGWAFDGAGQEPPRKDAQLWAGTTLEACIRDVALGRIANHSEVTSDLIQQSDGSWQPAEPIPFFDTIDWEVYGRGRKRRAIAYWHADELARVEPGRFFTLRLWMAARRVSRTRRGRGGEMSVNVKTDPLIVSLMRTFPTGDVRHVPGGGIGMTGTLTTTFLAEYDEALAEAYRRGFDDGYAVACHDHTRREGRGGDEGER